MGAEGESRDQKERKKQGINTRAKRPRLGQIVEGARFHGQLRCIALYGQAAAGEALEQAVGDL